MILVVPSDDLLIPCLIHKVKEDTVKALAQGYIANTGAAGCANNRLLGVKKWKEEQLKLYKVKQDGNAQ